MAYTVKPDDTIYDVAYNTSGSLAAIDQLLEQNPLTESPMLGYKQIGLNGEVPSSNFMESYTPKLEPNLILNTDNIPIYNIQAVSRAIPYNSTLMNEMEVKEDMFRIGRLLGEPYVQATPDSINVPVESSLIEIRVNTNLTNWRVTNTSEAWFTAQNTVGVDGEMLLVSIDENTVQQVRSGIITIIGESADADVENVQTTVSISQSASVQAGFIAKGTQDGYIAQLNQSINKKRNYGIHLIYESSEDNADQGVILAFGNVNNNTISLRSVNGYPHFTVFGAQRTYTYPEVNRYGRNDIFIGIGESENPVTILLAINGVVMEMFPINISNTTTASESFVLGAIHSSANMFEFSTIPVCAFRYFSRILYPMEITQLYEESQNLNYPTTIEDCIIELLPKDISLSTPFIGRWRDSSGNGNHFVQIGNPTYYFKTQS